MDVLKLLEDVKNDKVSLEEAAKELKEPKKPRGSKEPGKTDSHDYYDYDRMSPMGEAYE